jgi:thymidylate synthase (FAD)
MKVTLIGMTNPMFEDGVDEDVIYTAMSQCYNESFDEDDAKNTSLEDKRKVMKAVLKAGHDSISEHTNFTFLIEDVSLTCTHQLVRHRMASYSQRSARYTGLEDGEWFVVPPSIAKNKDALEIYLKTMKIERESYKVLTENFDIPKEDARFLLGAGKHTNIVVTMNCRSLKNFFAHRLCTRAQWEIRGLAQEMAKICKEKLPVVFDECAFAEAKCVQNGYCVEPKKQWCRKRPHISEIKG